MEENTFLIKKNGVKKSKHYLQKNTNIIIVMNQNMIIDMKISCQCFVNKHLSCNPQIRGLFFLTKKRREICFIHNNNVITSHHPYKRFLRCCLLFGFFLNCFIVFSIQPAYFLTFSLFNVEI